ncbi:MAG: tetratricopeptide repeat protein [Rhodomicrobiaceae bacterium]
MARSRSASRPVTAPAPSGWEPEAATPGWETEAEDLPSIGGDSGGGIQEARIAMRHGDLARAVEILKRSDGPDALELLGVAYQKNKQTDKAKEVYNEYLRRYGAAAEAESVR